MDGDRCQQPGCTGKIEDGYCNVCGVAPKVNPVGVGVNSIASKPSAASRASGTTGTGSSPKSRAAAGSKRTRHTSTRTQRQLGAGLVTLPELPSTDPEKAILVDAKVPEGKRFCFKCNNSLKREAGFCGKCGQRYSFVPSLNPGDIVANQYEVRGALAYGGLGWIYLGFDRILSRYVVLKGLLNAHDESSAAVAVAERKFLAAVKHPNIVGIYNFVPHGSEGFIVMEYVGGKTIKQIRQERGPLPVPEAIAYIHRILSAFSYLHQQGFVYCDFKPENMMLEKDDVKLIDMGGVRRIDDPAGDIYGTVGYSAPEAGEGPTVLSDLFTVGRTLAVLLTSIHGFSKEHRYTLPTPEEDPLFAKEESLYRCLLKSTAEKADDRFASADEMAEQLLGVLREVVARETGTPRPATSTHFGSDLLTLESSADLGSVRADANLLPIPVMDMNDPAFRHIMNAEVLINADMRLAALRIARQQVPSSREARLRLAAALGRVRQYDEAEDILNELEKEDAWDWRVLWYRGRMRLMQAKPAEAQALFDQVYFDLPGELSPKLALGLAAELAGHLDLAIKMYDHVAHTDPGIASAAFGLARCYRAKADRHAAVSALDLVPQGSPLYLRARVDAARTLISVNVSNGNGSRPAVTDLSAASALAESLMLEGSSRFVLSQQILAAALDLLTSRTTPPNPAIKILGRPLEENRVREELERSLRALARMSNGEERIRLIDEANRLRPRTLV